MLYYTQITEIISMKNSTPIEDTNIYLQLVKVSWKLLHWIQIYFTFFSKTTNGTATAAGDATFHSPFGSYSGDIAIRGGDNVCSCGYHD